MTAAAPMFPMQWSWRLVLALLPLAGIAVAGACLLELSGVVASGSLLGEATDAHRWIAVAFGVLVQPFGITALAHSRLTITEHELRYLGFGLLCRTRTIRFADVARWGEASAKRQGRRERMLLFALRDGTQRSIKLSMYSGIAEILELLRDRLGAPTPATITMAGVRFGE